MLQIITTKINKDKIIEVVSWWTKIFIFFDNGNNNKDNKPAKNTGTKKALA